MIQVQNTWTATNPNLLAATDLQSAPQDGVLKIYIVSTQKDWSFSLSAGEETPIRNQYVPQKTVAAVQEVFDPSIDLAVLAGQQLVLQCTVGTGGTGAFVAKFYPETEL
jgi:hypothetical protein